MIRLRVRSALRIVLTAFICLTLVSFSFLQIRYGAAILGILDIPQANAYEGDSGAAGVRAASYSIDAQYCSEVVAACDPSNPSGKTSTELNFNDAWLSGNSHVYNHDLATSCSILSAICNSESQFYGGISGSIPYAEEALSSLGFSDIRTDSFELRSNILDQAAAFFVSPHDVSAYVFASKTVIGSGDDASNSAISRNSKSFVDLSPYQKTKHADDAASFGDKENGENPGRLTDPDETIIFVGVRGSYGIEWLSNFKIFNNDDSSHQGFKRAEQEIIVALEKYVEEIGADPAHTTILVTGHSRGGSIANLLAADLNDRAGSSASLALADSIYAYTFAAPYTTQAADRSDKMHGNIFNVINPSDIAPQLPLSSWGFGRYGVMVSLPSSTDQNFAPQYSAMQTAYEKNTGYANPANSENLAKLDCFNLVASEAVPTAESMISLPGIYSVAGICFELDLATVCYTHYPDTYIAWMQSLDTKT